MLTDFQRRIINGFVCPYCHNNSVYIDSKIIYGKSYGMIYYCKPCDAYVGVHKGTDKALGRLANKELREAKKLAHSHFDKIWHSGKLSRSNAYKKLSEYLNLPIEYTHIGMFSVDTCNKVITFTKTI